MQSHMWVRQFQCDHLHNFLDMFVLVWLVHQAFGGLQTAAMKCHHIWQALNRGIWQSLEDLPEKK